jgi:hypothetical protein
LGGDAAFLAKTRLLLWFSVKASADCETAFVRGPVDAMQEGADGDGPWHDRLRATRAQCVPVSAARNGLVHLRDRLIGSEGVGLLIFGNSMKVS